MKERILNGWTFTRALYLIMGVIVIINAVTNRQWLGIVFGGYFASMGLFAFGCASGNCFGGNCEVEQKQISNATIQEMDFEEVKTK